MGITLTAFTDGTVMKAADMRSNLDTIRTFTNRGMVHGDLGGSFTSRHFRRLESYGSPNPRTTGVSGGIWRRSMDGSPYNTAIFSYDAVGSGWQSVWAAQGTLDIPENGRLEITACAWAWHIKTGSQLDPESGSYATPWVEAASMRLAIDADGIGYTGRRIWDASQDATSPLGYGSGPLRYPARQIGFTASEAVTAGIKQVGLQVYMEDFRDVTDAGLLYVRARVLTAEFYRR